MKKACFFLQTMITLQIVGRHLRIWRNRQTQQTQNLPMVTSCGFDSRHPHDLFKLQVLFGTWGFFNVGTQGSDPGVPECYIRNTLIFSMSKIHINILYFLCNITTIFFAIIMYNICKKSALISLAVTKP